MRIGLLVAMQEEIQDLIPCMQEVSQSSIGRKTTYIGKLYGTEVVLCLCGVGKVNAAMTAGILKTKYNVDIIILTGLAGSTSTKIHVGDIVISTQFIQHDVDARPNFPRFVIPFSHEAIISVDPLLSSLAVKASKQLVNNLSRKIDISQLTEFGIEKPVVHCGLIGTGDKFIVDTSVLDELIATINTEFNASLLCVEMESAAVAQSCAELGIPCIAVRVISDCPYLHESITHYHRFKQKIAAPYCNSILAEFLPLLQNLP
ncbi:MAG: 5'-methylthioadenosine/adenosylhomocysteine nucleosidase [Legionellales bacterium]|nr:5'-methylthioadenosine/adenosylhomocysteine nucleosidase [Legionellales bacterium]